jgi:hypothetical protein
VCLAFTDGYSGHSEFRTVGDIEFDILRQVMLDHESLTKDIQFFI